MELLECSPTDSFVRRLVLAGDSVETDSARGSGSRVLGLKILVSEERIFFDKFFEDVITDAPLPRRRADASVFERLCHTTGYASINSWSARGLVPEIFPLQKCSHDPRPFVARLALTDPHAFRFRQTDADTWRGKENKGLNPGWAFATESALLTQ